MYQRVSVNCISCYSVPYACFSKTYYRVSFISNNSFYSSGVFKYDVIDTTLFSLCHRAIPLTLNDEGELKHKSRFANCF